MFRNTTDRPKINSARSVPAAPSKTLAQVVRSGLCTGCGLCAGISNGAIRMAEDASGFLRPVQLGAIDDVTEQKIECACPGRHVAAWTELTAPATHPYWGPYRQAAVGFASDPEIRFRGSSGGVLSAIAIYALKTGYVDRVVHVTADNAFPTRNLVSVSRTPEAILDGAGSRYSASPVLGDIDEVLTEGGSFAIIGKPCDISAVTRLARCDPRVNRHLRLKLSFFCAGVPSFHAADRLVRAMGARPDDVEAFRYRGNGWPGNACAQLASGKKLEMSYADSWGGHLSKDVQFRCKICPDAVGGVADIACGDAWHSDKNGYPLFEECDGRSLVFARTIRGVEVLRAMADQGAIVTNALDLALVDGMQPSQARRKRLVAARCLGLTAAFHSRPSFTGTDVERASQRAGAGEKVRSFLGSARRALAERTRGQRRRQTLAPGAVPGRAENSRDLPRVGKQQPRVSVIIPHYHDLKGLDRCLSALDRQTYPASLVEILVADNNSPEGIAAVEEVVSGRGRVIPVLERGAGPARNGAVAHATAEVFAFVDSDCVPEPQWISEGVAALDHFDFAGGKVNVLVDNPERITPCEAFERVFAFDFENYINKKKFTGAGNLFCPRSVFETVGGFRNGISEDVDWSRRAQDMGYRLGYAPGAAVGHPARRQWNDLRRKWERIDRETYWLNNPRKYSRAKWLARTVALPVSIVIHTHKVLRSQKLRDWREKRSAIAVLARIRMWRCANSFRLLLASGRRKPVL